MQKFKLIGAVSCVALLAGCFGGLGTSRAERAEAVLAPTAGSQANGKVSFTRTGDKVLVTAEVSGLTPGARLLVRPFPRCDPQSAGASPEYGGPNP